ncbi:MAG TPA: hypothetical protein VIQ54_17785, partial [Polyangia bacterium]
MIRRSIGYALVAGVLVASVARPAAAQSAAARNAAGEVDLNRFFAQLPVVFDRIAQSGYREFFRLLQTLELFHFEAEIDRFVGKPREL